MYVALLEGNVPIAGAELPDYPPNIHEEKYYWQTVHMKQSV